MKEMAFTASIDMIGPVTDFVNEILAGLDCPEQSRIQIDVAVDEILSNIIRYAYPSAPGPATVRVEVEKDPLTVVMTFIDRGAPYNPLTAKAPDITLPRRRRPVGGLGLFMVRNTMDDLSYEYRDGQNILTVRKKI